MDSIEHSISISHAEKGQISISPGDDIWAGEVDITFTPSPHMAVPVTFQLYNTAKGNAACKVKRAGADGSGPVVDGVPLRIKGTVTRCKAHHQVTIRPKRDLSYLGVIDSNLGFMNEISHRNYLIMSNRRKL